jgi:hypothetical protein
MRVWPSVLSGTLLISAAHGQSDTSLQYCAAIPSPRSRLDCYDRLARDRAKEPPLTGVIQICRAPGIQGLHQEDSIEIPTGATMVNFGEKSSLVAGTAGDITIATIADTVLMHGKACTRIYPLTAFTG